jgi:hypothetical protein
MPSPLYLPSTKSTLIICLLLVQVLPTLPFYFGLADSMAAGTAAASVLILFTCWMYGAVWAHLPLSRLLTSLILPFLVLVFLVPFILLHAIEASQLQAIDPTRLAQTQLPLALLIVGGITLGGQIVAASDQDMDSAARASFWFLTGFLVLRLFGAEPASPTGDKAIFPYAEVSHYALAFGPMLMYQATRADPSRQLRWIFFGIAVAAVLQSVSLMVCCLLIALVCRKLTLVVGLGVVVFGSGLPLELSYYTSRLDFSSDTRNLSSLVYIQGWEQILESVGWTSGWGLGFEQLGSRESETGAGTLIRAVTGGLDSNLRDGSFVLVKLVSELGIFGLALVMAFVVMAVRSVATLRCRRMTAARTFARCVVVSYLIDMFLRGTGYFTESTLLFIAGVTALQLERYAPVLDSARASPDSPLTSAAA